MTPEEVQGCLNTLRWSPQALADALGRDLDIRIAKGEDRMLYLVVVMFCPMHVPSDKCDQLSAPRIDRHWVYRPNIEACVQFATELIIKDQSVPQDHYPKVFCPRAEPLFKSYS